MAELDAKLASKDEYDVLAISRPLRLLLDDDQPLVHQVNSTFRLKLRFNCARSYLLNLPDSLRPDTISSQDGFDPATRISGNQPIEVDLGGLLAEIVAVHEKRQLSVLDIIKYEANVGGGVHAGAPRRDRDVSVKEMNAAFTVGGYAPSLRQLQAIGRVVVRGLAELGNRVRSGNLGSS